MVHSDPALATESPLLATELPDAEELVCEAGWNQNAADWRAFLELGTVYAIRTSAGRVIATAATLPYGGQFAWISMVLVAREYQRRGLATRLLRKCIDDLTAANLVPVLDATPAGREVYRGLGFKDAWGFQRLARLERQGAPDTAAGPQGFKIHAIADEVWPKLCAYDARVFGADREKLLARLCGRAPDIDCFAERDGQIVGILLGRDGRIATQIGPLVADSDDIARTLLARAVDAIGGPIFVDVADSKKDLLAYLAMRGFAPQRPLTRMLLGRAEAFDDGVRTYAVVGPEFG
jgi:ribosomal protein S18 acetylase RimI-like enzyme